MDFSYTSVGMTIIVCNISFAGIYCIIKNIGLSKKIGYTALILSLLVMMGRLLFPVELLRISHNVYFPEQISKYVLILSDKMLFLPNITIAFFLWIIWLVVSVYKFFHLWTEYKLFFEEIGKKANNITRTEKVECYLKKYKKKRFYQLEVYEVNEIKTPLICGFLKQKILLPTKPYDDIELNYILQHEIYHYNNGDLLLKLLVSIVHCVFWWNPFTLLLRNEINTILEVRVDDMIVQAEESPVSYLDALLQIAKNEVDDIHVPIMAFTTNDSLLKIRFKYMMETGKTGAFKYTYLVVVAVVVLLSYTFIFEPDYIDPAVLEQEGAVVLTPENAYIIKKADGTFDIYYEGDFFGNVSHMDESLEGLKIINN